MTPSSHSAGAQHPSCNFAGYRDGRCVRRNTRTFDGSRRQWQLTAQDLFGSRFRVGPAADEPRHGSSDGMCFFKRVTPSAEHPNFIALQRKLRTSQQRMVGLGRSSCIAAAAAVAPLTSESVPVQQCSDVCVERQLSSVAAIPIREQSGIPAS